MAAPKVFVSHSHKDEDFTQRLVHDLHQAGAEVWVDASGITHGNFMQRIDEALEQCAWMVLVLTPNAISSQYVKDEIYAALHRVKLGHMQDVIPVLAMACAAGTIPPQWDTLHRYDATTDYASALAGVCRAIGLSLISIQPTDSLDTLLTRGKALMEQKEWTQAVSCFQQASKLDPSSFDVRVNLAMVLYSAGRYAEALVAYDRVLALDDQQQWIWVNKGLALQSLGRYEPALVAYDKALALDPTYSFAWCGKAEVLRELRRMEEALASFDQSLAFNPNYAWAWNNKGYTLHLIHRDEEAVDAYEYALAADPSFVYAWDNKAIALRSLGRETEAQEAERSAKELRSSS